MHKIFCTVITAQQHLSQLGMHFNMHIVMIYAIDNLMYEGHSINSDFFSVFIYFLLCHTLESDEVKSLWIDVSARRSQRFFFVHAKGTSKPVHRWGKVCNSAGRLRRRVGGGKKTPKKIMFSMS